MKLKSENWSDISKRLLKNPENRKAYEAMQPEFAIAAAIIRKRMETKMTQAQLAKKLGTKQSAVSRLESGDYNPSIGLLKKVAEALNLKLVVSMN